MSKEWKLAKAYWDKLASEADANGIWRGYATAAFEEIYLAQGHEENKNMTLKYYQRVKKRLTKIGCLKQEQSGGRNRPTRFKLFLDSPPNQDLWQDAGSRTPVQDMPILHEVLEALEVIGGRVDMLEQHVYGDDWRPDDAEPIGEVELDE